MTEEHFYLNNPVLSADNVRRIKCENRNKAAEIVPMPESVFIVWKDELSVSSPVLDNQHMRLFSIINNLHHAMQQGLQQRQMLEVIEMLRRYAVTHFVYEEKLLHQRGFPNIEQHRQAHHIFVQRVDAFELQLQTEQGDLSFEVLTFLRLWLINHILHMDMEYAPYLNHDMFAKSRPERIAD